MFIFKEENAALQLLNESVKMFVPETNLYDSLRYIKNQHETEKRTGEKNLN